MNAADIERTASPRRRQARIMEMILNDGTMRVEEIAEALNVSLVTIYRDLAALEKMNMVVRNRGEVSAGTSSLSEQTPRLRLQSYLTAKRAIAKAAAKLISPGNSIMVDDSSTAVPLIEEIVDLVPLTVITNSNPVLRLLEPNNGISLISLGGQYRRWADSYHGTTTVAGIESMFADICIMSDAAIFENMVCNPYEYVVETKRAMLKSSDKAILLADSSKFGRRALHTTVPLTVFDVVVSDSNLPEETRTHIVNQDIELIIAQL